MERLLDYFRQQNSVAIAFSGGVDSTLLAWVATKALGDKALMVTIETPYIATWEIEEAKAIAKEYGFNHKIITLEIPTSIKNNPNNRCYLCKSIIMETILSTIERLNIPTLCDGSNIDDTGDYRPGLKALKECGVRSPFIELGIGKEEIRSLSKSVSLPTWDKPAYACLLTRLQYNTPITKKAIEQIDRAEEILHEYGYRAVRVRHHDSVARIELSSDSIENFMQNRNKLEIDRRIKNLGFTFVSVELSGYNTGSLNRTINLDREQ